MDTFEGNGIDMLRACIEVVDENTPSGDRVEIDRLKEIMRQKSLMMPQLETPVVAMSVLLGLFQQFMEETKNKTKLPKFRASYEPTERSN